MKLYKYIFLLISAFIFTSCLSENNIKEVGVVVAEVNGHKLYSSELEMYVPKGISKEDSIGLALKYINTWASDLIFLEMAEKNLSKQEQDVKKELEEYRRSLLKYRYEKRYINERLDTIVSLKEIDDYYNNNINKYILKETIIKAVFLKITGSIPEYNDIKRLFLSNNMDDLQIADSLASYNCLVYHKYDNKWIGIDKLAKDFNIDSNNILSLIKNNKIELIQEREILAAFIFDIQKEGKPAPVEYVEDDIKNNILSLRRRNLLNNLEIDILQNAKDENNFIIY